MLAKCGEINVWHWAHVKGESCDAWYEPETLWHRTWKASFKPEWTEVIIARDGKRHIADVLTNKGLVIELQNSPISPAIIREREAFYGDTMMWIVNAKPFRNNFGLLPYEAQYPEYMHQGQVIDWPTKKVLFDEKQLERMFTFRWNWPRKCWWTSLRYVFFDLGDEFLYSMNFKASLTGSCKRYTKVQFVRKYGGDIERVP